MYVSWSNFLSANSKRSKSSACASIHGIFTGQYTTTITYTMWIYHARRPWRCILVIHNSHVLFKGIMKSVVTRDPITTSKIWYRVKWSSRISFLSNLISLFLDFYSWILQKYLVKMRISVNCPNAIQNFMSMVILALMSWRQLGRRVVSTVSVSFSMQHGIFLFRNTKRPPSSFKVSYIGCWSSICVFFSTPSIELYHF